MEAAAAQRVGRGRTLAANPRDGMGERKAARLRPQENLPVLHATERLASTIGQALRALKQARPLVEVEDLERWRLYQQAVQRLAAELRVVTGGDPTHARYVERVEGGRGLAVHARLIVVAPWLAQHLWTARVPNPADPEPTPRPRTLIATSATLMSGGSFAYWQARVGCPSEVMTLAVPSPFAFATQALLYVPQGREALLPPKIPSGAYLDALTARIEVLLEASDGRALVLFTSYRVLGEVVARLTGRLPWLMLVQGGLPACAALAPVPRRRPFGALRHPQLLGGGRCRGRGAESGHHRPAPVSQPRRSLVGGALRGRAPGRRRSVPRARAARRGPAPETGLRPAHPPPHGPRRRRAAG